MTKISLTTKIRHACMKLMPDAVFRNARRIYYSRPVRLLESQWVGHRMKQPEPVYIRTPRHGDFTLYTSKANYPPWMDYLDNKCHEPITTEAMLSRVEKGTRVWDIGSRIGYFGMLCANFTDPGMVHIFEPDPVHLEMIYRNNELLFNGKVWVYDGYAGSRHDPQKRRMRLGRYAKVHGYPDLVKIDVDGPELDVILGMGDILQKSRPTILVEIHFHNMNPNCEEESGKLLGHLESYGYKLSMCKDFFGSMKWEPLTKETRPLKPDTSFGWGDAYMVLAVPENKQ